MMAGIDPRYADVEYWDVRYNDDRNTDGTYDWLTVWTNVADIVKALVPNTDTPCLHPGSGTQPSRMICTMLGTRIRPASISLRWAA